MTGVEAFLAANTAAMSAASTAATIGGAVFSAIQGFQQQQAARARAQYQANVAARNKEIARQNAVLERRAGDESMSDQRREVARRLGAIRNNIGANGLGVFGSPLEVLSDTATEGALSVRRLGQASVQRARAFELEELGHADQASLARAEAESLKSTAAAFLGGALSTAGAATKSLAQASQINSFSKEAE